MSRELLRNSRGWRPRCGKSARATRLRRDQVHSSSGKSPSTLEKAAAFSLLVGAIPCIWRTGVADLNMFRTASRDWYFEIAMRSDCVWIVGDGSCEDMRKKGTILGTPRLCSWRGKGESATFSRRPILARQDKTTSRQDRALVPRQIPFILHFII